MQHTNYIAEAITFITMQLNEQQVTLVIEKAVEASMQVQKLAK